MCAAGERDVAAKAHRAVDAQRDQTGAEVQHYIPLLGVLAGFRSPFPLRRSDVHCTLCSYSYLAHLQMDPQTVQQVLVHSM
jgi:hypothetical protein